MSTEQATTSVTSVLARPPDSAAYRLPVPVQRDIPVVRRTFPVAVRASPAVLTPAGRRTSLHLCAGPGVGKSRLMGRSLIWQDILDGKAIVLCDGAGGSIDNCIDKILRCPSREFRAHLLSRITYIDLGATDFIVPMPIYFRMGENDTASLAANRLIEVIRRADPDLLSASIQGFNSLASIAHPAGVIAYTLGLQIADVAAMVRNPKRWKVPLQAAKHLSPEAAWAVEAFQDYASIPDNQKPRQAGSLLAKLRPFETDPQMRAMFASHRWGFHFAQVDQPGQITLIDGRSERNRSNRNFKMLWSFTNLMEYYQLRGIAGRDNPVNFYIDEVTQLLGFRAQEHSVMAEDLEELASVFCRNYGVNLCVSHQNMSQCDERIQNVLMQMGTQLVGRVRNPYDADLLSSFLFGYDPYREKKRVPVWMNVQRGWGRLAYSEPEIIDYTTQEFSPEEQRIAAKEKIQNLPKFEFLGRVATDEGSVSQTLRRLSIAGLDPGQYPDEEILAEARRLLRKRDGYPMAELLAEIDRQGQEVIAVKAPSQPKRTRRKKRKKQNGILAKGDDTVHGPDRSDHLPESGSEETTSPPDTAGSARPTGEKWKDDLWHKP